MSNYTTLFMAAAIGGVLIAAMGTAQTLYVQEEPVEAKGVFRDFFIGAIMVALLYQLIPDSFTSMTDMMSGFKIPSFPSIGGGGGVSDSIANAVKSVGKGEVGDFDLQTGVPRF
jgi:hypothetical protein